MPKIGTRGNLCANCGRSGIHNLEDCPTDPRNKITPKDLFISAILVGQAVSGKLDVHTALEAAETILTMRLNPGEAADQAAIRAQTEKAKKVA